MNTIEQGVRANANKRSKGLTKDSQLYVAGTGQFDRDTLGHDMSKRSVALRLVLGATANMPHRALSYVESAARIAGHFPGAQLQIIHANNLGNKVNGVDITIANAEALRLAEMTADLATRFPGLDGRLVHGLDVPMNTNVHLDAIRSAMHANPALADRMHQKGETHGGSAEQYMAAHVAFQDTDDLEINGIHGADQAAVDTIISIGCGQERNFYDARMAVHATTGKTTTSDAGIQTAQIFTHHVSPPYFMARGGEPMLGDDFNLEDVADTPAQRDLAFLIASMERAS